MAYDPKTIKISCDGGTAVAINGDGTLTDPNPIESFTWDPVTLKADVKVHFWEMMHDCMPQLVANGTWDTPSGEA